MRAKATPVGHGQPLFVFVLTHEGRAPATKEKTTFTFVTDGVESAIRQVQQAAGDKNVVIATASILQQALKAGLVDELYLEQVPLLLGGGVRLFDNLDAQTIALERFNVVAAPGVTHLRFRVVK